MLPLLNSFATAVAVELNWITTKDADSRWAIHAHSPRSLIIISFLLLLLLFLVGREKPHHHHHLRVDNTTTTTTTTTFPFCFQDVVSWLCCWNKCTNPHSWFFFMSLYSSSEVHIRLVFTFSAHILSLFLNECVKKFFFLGHCYYMCTLLQFISYYFFWSERCPNS